LHSLDDASLAQLLERLENNELDDYGDIATLIGIEFDDNTVWGQLTVLELKLLIHLALKQFEDAQELVGAFLQYNDNTVERGLFYQALNVVLEVLLDDDMDLDDYEVNFRRMFGDPRMDAAMGSIDGSVRFFGLTPTSMGLEGLDRHQRLMDSYKKVHTAQAEAGMVRQRSVPPTGCEFCHFLQVESQIRGFRSLGAVPSAGVGGGKPSPQADVRRPEFACSRHGGLAHKKVLSLNQKREAVTHLVEGRGATCLPCL
jgi:hypothetical protein